MAKPITISWSDFAKALGLELSDTPLEDYEGIDAAYEAGNAFIREYEVENEVELSEDAKQQVINEFSMSLETHWSPAKVMYRNLKLDSLVDNVNDWSKRGPQMAIYERELASGTAIASVDETEQGLTLSIEEPFLIAYAEAAYAVHGVADEGKELDDVDAKDVANVMRWIAEAEGRSIDNYLDLDRWDQQWGGPSHRTVTDIADKGVIAENKPEGVTAAAFLHRVAAIDFDRMSAPELRRWIDRTMKTYLSFKSKNPNQIEQLQPILRSLQMAQLSLDMRPEEGGSEAGAAVVAGSVFAKAFEGFRREAAEPFVPTHLQKWNRQDPAGNFGEDNYMGAEYNDYYVVGFQTRDSDALERSNFRSMLEALGGEDEDTGVIVARSGHWAVGWVEKILVNQNATDKLKIADDIAEGLEDYPVVDEEDFSRVEWEERENDFESWGRRDMANMFKNALPEPVFEKVEADPTFEQILSHIFMGSAGYYGEDSGPKDLEDVANHWGDVPSDLHDSYAYKIMNSVINGGPIAEGEEGSEGLTELIDQNPDHAERIMQEYHKGKDVDAIRVILDELKTSEDPRQMKMFESDELKRAAENVDWESELYEGEPKSAFDIDTENIGTWVEGGDAETIGNNVQQYAKKFGWDGAIRSSDEDGFYDAVQEAEDFLNTKAPAGFFFGTNENGDWGLWEGEVALPLIAPEDIGEEAEVVAAPEGEAEDKEISEVGEEEMPPELKASKHYGSTVRYLKRLAADMPPEMKQELEKDPQLMAEQDSVTGKWVVKKKVSASNERIFKEVTIASEFYDDLYPRINADIDAGTKVFIRPIKRFGEVVRTLDDGGAFRVQAGDTVTTYFRQELEVRKTSR
jgi:hypothetical protein